jgi:hypothetical protein
MLAHRFAAAITLKATPYRRERPMPLNDLRTRIRTRQFAGLRAFFPNLTERELIQLLTAPPQHAALVLQWCCALQREEAQFAWNDYVLRYFDGHASPGGLLPELHPPLMH